MKKPNSYGDYYDSGVAWLGQVPSHWPVIKLGHLLSRNDGGVWGEDYDEEGTIVLRSTEVTVDGRWLLENPARRSLTRQERSKALLQEGDLVITKSSGSEAHIGKTAIVDRSIAEQRCAFANFMQRVRVRPGVIPRYVHYYINNVIRPQLSYYGETTTGLRNLNAEAIASFTFLKPSTFEQTNIVRLLDSRIPEIDSLIAEKERLIALLQEQRQAIITEAVTKGLDPAVPMEDSGVEWIGQVPEHWGTVLLKRVARLKSGEGITSREIQDAGEYPVYGGNGLRGFTSNYTHSGHHALIGRQGALCGNIHVVEEKFWASEHAVVVTTAESVDWLGFVLETMNLNQYSESAAQPGISVDRVKNLSIPLPPHKEQLSIADHLKKCVRETRELIELTSRAVVQLSDYRQALITEAVTGKIDVRGEV